MKFCERLRELRIDRGLTQKKLAEFLGLEKTAVKHWENGTNETDFKTLIKIADYFEVTLDYLLGRKDT